MTIQEFISSPQKMVIHCRNAQEYEELCIALDNAGATWCSGKKYWNSIIERPSDDYNSNYTGMSNRGTCADVDWFRNFTHIDVIPFEAIDFTNAETQAIDIGLLVNSRTIIGKNFRNHNSMYTRTVKSVIINQEGVFVIDENKMRHKIENIVVL